jgi:hypothetical protein
VSGDWPQNDWQFTKQMINTLIRAMGLVLVTVILIYALREKGAVSTSLSILKILEFKLDVKEKRAPPSEEGGR